MKGADKALLPLAGKPLIAHVIARAAPQVDGLIINANGETSRFDSFGPEVVPDLEPGHLGPIAGLVAAYAWVRHNRLGAAWVITFACDCPFFPADLVDRLIGAAQNCDVPVAVASSPVRHQPVFAAWSARLPISGRDLLQERGLRRMDDLIDLFPNTRVEFEMESSDPFFNINTPDDLLRAELLMREPANA